MALSSLLTKIVLKILWLLDQCLGPTFPMDWCLFMCIWDISKSAAEFPSNTPKLSVPNNYTFSWDLTTKLSIPNDYSAPWNLCTPTKTDYNFHHTYLLISLIMTFTSAILFSFQDSSSLQDTWSHIIINSTPLSFQDI